MPYYVAVLVSGGAVRHATPCYATFSPTGIRAISIFYQFIQFLGAANGGEVVLSSSLLYLLAYSAKHPVGQLPCLPPAGPARPLLHHHPCSRGSRPVSAGAIGKQRPKMCFPTSSPSLTSKHSNGPRKNVAGPQFLLTMILLSFRRCVLRRENLTNLKIYDIIYLQGEGRKKNLHHHLHYA